jgi:mRNA-degrading endonuclease toxin of MazEF toxin-antitoxin module
VPAPTGDLRRGRIVYGLFPFATEFPVELADGTRRLSVEQFAVAHRGEPVRLVVEARLRPVLLLHDGTRGEHGDVVCLRVNTVKPTLKTNTRTWQRIVNREHPLFFHLPAAAGRYGLRSDSVIAISSVGAVSKSALLGPPVGGLTQQEMHEIDERLARGLQLDLAPLIAARARDLLKRAGIGEGYEHVSD